MCPLATKGDPWDSTTPLEETLRFLHDSVTNGKIAYYGFSNFLGWQLTKAVHSQGWSHPVTLQRQYSLLVRELDLEVVPASGRKHWVVAVVALVRRLAVRQVQARRASHRRYPPRRESQKRYGSMAGWQRPPPHMGRY